MDEITSIDKISNVDPIEVTCEQTVRKHSIRLSVPRSYQLPLSIRSEPVRLKIDGSRSLKVKQGVQKGMTLNVPRLEAPRSKKVTPRLDVLKLYVPRPDVPKLYVPRLETPHRTPKKNAPRLETPRSRPRRCSTTPRHRMKDEYSVVTGNLVPTLRIPLLFPSMRTIVKTKVETEVNKNVFDLPLFLRSEPTAVPTARMPGAEMQNTKIVNSKMKHLEPVLMPLEASSWEDALEVYESNQSYFLYAYYKTKDSTYRHALQELEVWMQQFQEPYPEDPEEQEEWTSRQEQTGDFGHFCDPRVLELF